MTANLIGRQTQLRSTKAAIGRNATIHIQVK